MLSRDERDALRELLAAGTELPWQVGDSQLGEAWVWAEVRGYMRGIGAPPARELVHAPPARLFEAGRGEQAVADARLIAAAVNALPGLLDDLNAWITYATSLVTDALARGANPADLPPAPERIRGTP